MEVERNNSKGEYEKVTLKVTLGAKKDMPQESKAQQKEEEQKTEEPITEEVTPDEFFEEFEDFFRY